MKYRLRPDGDMAVRKIRIDRIPTLVVTSKDPGKNGPGILWIHGGGYILGMKEMVYMSRAMDLVKRYGAVVLSPGYPLAWCRPAPAASEACFRVLCYMRDHAEELGIRADQLMVGGESAGGGLTAAVCMMARDRGVPVAFQMPLYPMLSDTDTESSRNNHGKVWNTRKNHLAWRLYLRGLSGKEISPYIAPARQTDYTGLPPCYTFVGDGEPFYSETLRYAENLRAAGVEAEADVYSSDVHAFDMLRPEEERSRKAADAFCRRFEYAMTHYFTEEKGPRR